MSPFPVNRTVLHSFVSMFDTFSSRAKFTLGLWVFCEVCLELNRNSKSSNHEWCSRENSTQGFVEEFYAVRISVIDK